MDTEIKNFNATAILDELHDYFSSRENYFNGRHKTEIAAEQALRDGHSDLADNLQAFHGYLKDMNEGNFRKGLTSIKDEIEGVSKHLGLSKYKEIIGSILSGFKNLTLFVKENLDTTSIEIASIELKKEKADCFPEDMTMVERLNQWQERRGEGKTAERYTSRN